MKPQLNEKEVKFAEKISKLISKNDQSNIKLTTKELIVVLQFFVKEIKEYNKLQIHHILVEDL